jgi:Flp pilus assembly protein TadD
MRTGEFRICPQCQARNKATQPSCVQCGRALFGIPLSRAQPVPAEAAAAHAAMGASWTRWAMAAGVLIALAFGLFVRGTFRGAELEPMAAGETVSASGPAPPSLTASAVPAAPPPTIRDFEKGRALLERGDAQGALRALTPVAQAEPDNAVIAHTYGRALWATGSRDRAVVQFERAARIDPHTPVYRIDLGRSLAALRRTREAIREYEAAVSLDPGNADTVLALAGLYARAGDNVESRALLERATMLRAGDATLAQRLTSADGSQTATSYTPSTPSSPSLAISASSAVAASSSGSSVPARAPSSGIVYTEEDLRRAGTGRTPGAVAPQPPPPVVRADGGGLGEDEAKWRDKATDRREAVRSAQQLVVTQRARVAQLQRQAEGQSSADADVERELTQALEDLDSAQERLAKAQRRMEDLQDEARRKSVPSDWLR